MMDSKVIRITAAVLCCLAGVSLATQYGWIAEDCTAENPCDWSDENSWAAIGCSALCYLRTTDDDAGIVDCGTTANLTESLEIDDLSLTGDGCGVFRGSQVFTTDDSASQLTITADSITINSMVIITVEKKAGLIADGADSCTA